MIVYRGTRDVSPIELEHFKKAQAVYGDATYYALHYSDARMYSLGGYGYCAIVCTYEISPKNCLIIKEGSWSIKHISDAKKPQPLTKELQDRLDYQNSQLAPVQLSKVATESGYDAIHLQGFVEGGEQLVVPNEINLEVLSLDVSLSKSILGYSKIGDQVEKFKSCLLDKGIVVKENNYQLEFSLSSSQLIQLTDLFKFLFEVTKGRSFYDINYETLQIESYEGDE